MSDHLIIWDDLQGEPPTPEMVEKMRAFVDYQIAQGRLHIGGIRVYDDGRVERIT